MKKVVVAAKKNNLIAAAFAGTTEAVKSYSEIGLPSWRGRQIRICCGQGGEIFEGVKSTG